MRPDFEGLNFTMGEMVGHIFACVAIKAFQRMLRSGICMRGEKYIP
jgi:hypothetical protein